MSNVSVLGTDWDWAVANFLLITDSVTIHNLIQRFRNSLPSSYRNFLGFWWERWAERSVCVNVLGRWRGRMSWISSWYKILITIYLPHETSNHAQPSRRLIMFYLILMTQDGWWPGEVKAPLVWSVRASRGWKTVEGQQASHLFLWWEEDQQGGWQCCLSIFVGLSSSCLL